MTNPGEIDPELLPSSPVSPGLINAVVRFLSPPREEDALRLQLLRLQLSAAQGATAFSWAPWPFFTERADIVCLGPRGSGKTATAWAAAQSLAAELDVQLLAVNWKKELLPPGATAVGEEWTRARDAVVLIDEAALQVGIGRRAEAIWETLALARHRNVSTIWTSQDAASVRRELLRLEPALVFAEVPRWASRLDRPEIAQLHAQAAAVLHAAQRPVRPGVRAIMRAGAWFAADTPLPEGWSEAMSKAHR